MRPSASTNGPAVTPVTAPVKFGGAWSLMCAESAVAGEALEGIRAQQTDFVAGLLAAWVPDASAQQLTGWAHVVVGACERLAIWRAGDPSVTAEQATDYLMDLVWTGLAAAR